MSKARDIANLLTDGKVEADDLNVGQLGGRRNLIINGGFDVWQRGTSWTNVLTEYTADRWKIFNDGNTAGANVTKEGNDIRVVNNTGHQVTLYQIIEEIPKWTGETKTLILSVDGDGDFTVGLSLYNGTRGYVAPSYENRVDVQTYTFEADERMQAEILIENGADVTIRTVQLELGNVATPFEHRSYGEELALCQRYYYAQQYTFRSQYKAAGSTWIQSLFPTEMRAAPSMVSATTTASGGVTNYSSRKVMAVLGSDSNDSWTWNGGDFDAEL